MIIPLFSQGNLHTEELLYSGDVPFTTLILLCNINLDRIVGIGCDFPNSTPLFILGVYLPSASHNIIEFNEYFDHLWALYDSLSVNWFVIVMGDLNGDLGNFLEDKAKNEPNQLGIKLPRAD